MYLKTRGYGSEKGFRLDFEHVTNEGMALT